MQKNFANKLEQDLNASVPSRQNTGCAVLVIDAEKKIALLTPAAANLLGLKNDEGAGQALEALPESLQKIVAKTSSNGLPVSGQITFAHSGHVKKSLSVSATPTVASTDNGSEIVVVLNDLSTGAQSEEGLERLDRLASIGTLSASMAHEIKNALVAVKTFMDLLLSQNQHDELAGIVSREMTRIDSIVSQMLTFAGPAKPVMAPIRMHDVLNHSLHLVQHQLGQKKIKLNLIYGAAPDLVRGDDYQLKQAFLNLFLNALEATPAEGSLTVITELIDLKTELPSALRENKPTHLRVVIRDSGAGIPAENLGRVFEPFFTTKPKGTGLGLPITKRIIHEHRGTISVENQPKKGAEFSIVLPLPP